MQKIALVLCLILFAGGFGHGSGKFTLWRSPGRFWVLVEAIHLERSKTRAGLTFSYADIATKLNENKLTMPQVENLAAAIEGKRRKEEVSIEPAGSELHPYWTQGAMNERAAGAAALADTQLHKALVELSPLLSDEEKTALDATQSAWESFRTCHVRFSGLDFSGGSIESLICNTENEAVALQRVAMLRAIIEQRKARV